VAQFLVWALVVFFGFAAAWYSEGVVWLLAREKGAAPLIGFVIGWCWGHFCFAWCFDVSGFAQLGE